MTSKFTGFIQDEIDKLINSNPIINDLKDQNMVLLNQLLGTTDKTLKETIEKRIIEVNSLINENIKIVIKNFDFDYYIKVFKKEDPFRESFNDNLIKNMEIINIFLFIILFFFIGISLMNQNLTVSELIEVFTENILTFMFVGIVEVWFFINVAFKFVPAPPSDIFIKLFTALKYKFI
jgi:hypothetical protein